MLGTTGQGGPDIMANTLLLGSINVATDGDAATYVANVRQDETVALIRVRDGEYRAVMLTAAEQDEAEGIAYTIDHGEGLAVVARRHLRAGETLLGIW
jgi:hypothetical protein